MLSSTRALTTASMLALMLQLSSCIWLDDFGKFKIGDAGEREFPDASDVSDASDGQVGRAKTDAASADAATSERCKDVDCSGLTTECAKGSCDPTTGKCVAHALRDGDSCFDGDPCTFGDSCKQGKCTGVALDCSALDDECSQGVCDPKTGGCTFGPNRMSQPCDDANACTINDRCTDDPEQRCLGDDAPAGMSCTDFNSCTGTDAEPDACDGNGRCDSGGPVAQGTSCDDDSECTSSDKCDGNGVCGGTPVREGEPCQQDCTSNTKCKQGECVPDNDAAPTYNTQCLSSFCGISDICLDKWKTDLTCQCGCGYDDSACSACSPYMCQNHGDHKAARWCDKDGKSAGNCPDTLKNDGKCDCGCQFDDPDCNGSKCCSGTGKKGCDDSYVEECVCQRNPNGDSSCCDGEWTDRCAQLAVNLGCMLCPKQ